jgi:hypothetical protein
MYSLLFKNCCISFSSLPTPPNTASCMHLRHKCHMPPSGLSAFSSIKQNWHSNASHILQFLCSQS